MHYLLVTALRAGPDRILVGEVRDGACLALVDKSAFGPLPRATLI
jgi:Flp pilus assembly CpaF family ATPase